MAAGDSAKADQIAFHIYTKLFHVLYAARASEQGPLQGKTDKWFNLETPLAAPGSTPTAELDAYRALSTAPPPPALAVQILLVVPPPGGGTALVHKPSGTRIEPEPRHVLLEEWILAFTPSPPSAPSTSSSSVSDTSRSSSTDEEADVLPPTIYKNAIPLFRALFALLRILPAWRVVRKLAGRRAPAGGVQSAAGGKRGLRVMVRLRPEGHPQAMGGAMWSGGNGGHETTLGFGESPAPEAGTAPLPTSTHVFPGIAHPAGTLTLSATYLTTPTFSLESLEALISSRFAVLDARPALDVGGSRRDAPSASTDYARNRTASASGNARYQQQQQHDEDDDAEFVPTLARRSITTSTASTASMGAGAGSPGRYTTPLPPAGSSPGRYSYTSALRPRVESLRTAGEGFPYRTSTASDAPSHSSPYRTTSDASPYRTISESSGSASTSYRMGVHVAPGHRRESSGGGGGDVVDRFVLPRSGASSLSGAATSPLAMRGSPSSVPSPLALREGAGGTGSMGTGAEYAYPYGPRPLPSEREREREREKGVPIGVGVGSGGGGAGMGIASGSGSSGAGGISASGPSAIAINPFKSNTLSRSSLTGSLLRGVSVAGSPGRTGGATSPMGVVFPAHATPPPLVGGESGGAGTSAGSGSVAGGGGGGVGIPMRKRYSSSFPHRYGAAAGSSVGSGGSGESGSASGSVGVGAPPIPRERTPSAGGSRGGSRSGSFLKSPTTDAQHDDISAFVKDIDAARPLLGRYRQQQQGDTPDPERAREPDDGADADSSTAASGSSSPGTSRGGTVRGSTAGGAGARTITPGVGPAAFGAPQAMLTSADEVDARLRSMNEEFMRSLVGLGGQRGSMMMHSPVSAGSGSASASGGGSGSGSGSGGQGSEEVIGRLEFDFEGHGRGR
ncbi:autophagy-related protein 13-domain-containing protein [Mycena capillaripes]|nr:autophagy-related protein 13-domain-containing protein [Mycena capillaripes]